MRRERSKNDTFPPPGERSLCRGSGIFRLRNRSRSEEQNRKRRASTGSAGSRQADAGQACSAPTEAPSSSWRGEPASPRPAPGCPTSSERSSFELRNLRRPKGSRSGASARRRRHAGGAERSPSSSARSSREAEFAMNTPRQDAPPSSGSTQRGGDVPGESHSIRRPHRLHVSTREWDGSSGPRRSPQTQTQPAMRAGLPQTRA